MTTLREAAQQALEALEGGGDSWRLIGPAIEALKAALEKPERHVSYVCPQCHWSLEQPEQEQHTTVHMSHCNQGEWDGVCKYGEEQCPALEQPEQEPEPVAWQWLNTAHFRKKLPAKVELGAWTPLYTHPSRREWRGLTEAEVEDVWMRSPQSSSMRECLQKYARAVEAKLKERNA